MKRLSASLLSTIFFTSAALAQGGTLDIGDPAPAFRPSQWLKGKPIPKLEKGQVYVVEFWATWCGPCKVAMPKLSAMARKYAKQVAFIGVDAAEGNALPKVAEFMRQQGQVMDYRVAADGPNGRIAADWMHAAGEVGIPVSFVVDKTGAIAWIGHAPEELDKVLPTIVAGKHSLTAERTRRAATRDPHDAVSLAIGDGDFRRAVTLIDAELAKNPSDVSYALTLYTALSHFDVPQLRRRVRADLERTKGDFGTYNFATIALTMGRELPVDAYRFGVELVEEAVKVSDARLMLLARGAEMASKAGDASKAVELQTLALKEAEATPNCTPERLAELQKDLERFKAAVKA